MQGRRCQWMVPQAITQTIGVPQGVSADGAGGFYVSSSQNRVYHVGSEGVQPPQAGRSASFQQMEERRRFPSSSFRINLEEQLPYRRLVFPQPLGRRSASMSNSPELMGSQARFKAVLPWPTIPSLQ